MNHLRFSDLEYPDGQASDPGTLGWMQGSPPPPERRIRFTDQRMLDFPQIRWVLSHLRELLPTVNVWRGNGPVRELIADTASRPTDKDRDGGGEHDIKQHDIDQLQFDSLDGRRCRWGQSLSDTYTDGIVVLHRGRMVYQRYFGALKPQLPHACFSITKSYAATLAATLVHERVIDDARVVPYYLPEMAATAYADATLRDLLDMQVGVSHSERYDDPGTQFWTYARAAGFCPPPLGDGANAGASTGAGAGLHQFLLTLRKQGVHGQAFNYKSVNTEVLCWAMHRATGVPLAEMLSQRLWSQLGCEEDAYISVDPLGVAMGGAGMAATLRDLARFGELMRCEGALERRQLIPAAVIADIRRGGDPGKFAKAGYALLPGYSYRNMWWITHNEHHAFEARGIHGQRLYVAPAAEMVVARFASHPIASSAANDPITVPALIALGRLLGS
jgi:CubicO group peptidase (beta-lactamase class C family)